LDPWYDSVGHTTFPFAPWPVNLRFVLSNRVLSSSLLQPIRLRRLNLMQAPAEDVNGVHHLRLRLSVPADLRDERASFIYLALPIAIPPVPKVEKIPYLFGCLNPIRSHASCAPAAHGTMPLGLGQS